jgi:uncharacterized damage-inducible protein DinB
MRLDTSDATSFDVQRNMLSEYLVSLCRARRVDITLAEKVIEALDALDARQFDTIQRSTLDEPSQRGNSYLDVYQHMSKAMRLYLAFIEKKQKEQEVRREDQSESADAGYWQRLRRVLLP